MDGIDECENGGVTNDNSSVTSFLKTVSRIADGTNTRILITSREDTAIRQGFMNNTGATVVEYKISPQDVRPDIDEYSRVVVRQKLIGRDGNTCEDLCQKMAERCEGQFLWIKLKGSRLSRYKAATLLKAEIEKTPSGLDDLYGRNWDGIGAIEDPDDRERAYAMMRWVSFATRPLTVAELTAALLVDLSCDNMQLDEIPYLLEDDYVENEILKMSASLLEIHEPLSETDAPDASAQTVHFTHFTAKQYFILRMAEKIDTLMVNERLRSSVQVACNNELASKCLHYISMAHVWKTPSENVHPIYRSFRDYAADEWYEHASASDHGEVVQRANDFFTKIDSVWKLWRDWFDIRRAGEGKPHKVVHEEPLCYATHFNLNETAKHLIESGHCNVDGIHLRSGLTTLQIDIVTRNLDIASALLDAGSDIFLPGRNGFTALHAVSQMGELKLIENFLDRGADVNTPNDIMLTPLHYASIHGQTAAVQMLLDRGANRSAISEAKSTALHLASYRGRLEVARKLLQDCSDTNTRKQQMMSPLFQAAADGNVNVVKLLLERGGDPFVVNDEGLTLTQITARYGYLDVFQVLLDAGLDVDTHKGLTPLHHACVGGHADMVRMLLARGANINAMYEGLGALHAAAFYFHLHISDILLSNGLDLDTAINTPFHITAGQGSVGMVRFLLECAAKVSEINRDSQLIPFHASVTRGQSSVTRLLIEENDAFGVNARTDDGLTPAHLAARAGHVDLIQMLIDHGADVSMAEISGKTPLHDAARFGHVEIVRLLIKQEAKYSIIGEDCFASMHSNACSEGNVEIVKFLPHAKDSLETRVDGDWTPLMLACEQLHADVVQLLLGSGAALTAKTANGLTPLHAAALQGHTEVVKLCLDSGAFIDTADVEGDTPLIDASIWGRIDTIKLLLDRGANLEATNLEGQTSLEAASCQGQTAVAKLLLESGAKKDVTNYFGSTPLMVASYLGHTAIVKLLLENGANVEARDVDGRTPSIAASYAGNDEVLELLLSKGCCTETTGPEVRDRFGQTALSFAVRLRKHAVARRLLSTGKVSLLSRDQFGRTPVSWAKGLGYANVDDFFADEEGAKVEQAPELREDEGLVTQDRGTDTECNSGRAQNSELQNETGKPAQETWLEYCEPAEKTWSRYCDVCRFRMTRSLAFRTCKLCLAGPDSYDMCNSCYDLGARCLNPDHSLKETTGESTSKLPH